MEEFKQAFSLSERPTSKELEEYVICKYSNILSTLPRNDPGVFIYYHPDADIDACLVLDSAPPSLLSPQAFKDFMYNTALNVQSACIYQSNARMLVLSHMTGAELQRLVYALRNGIWHGKLHRCWKILWNGWNSSAIQ
jgi:hypothetical protein